jgi:hypothetical protein
MVVPQGVPILLDKNVDCCSPKIARNGRPLYKNMPHLLIEHFKEPVFVVQSGALQSGLALNDKRSH